MMASSGTYAGFETIVLEWMDYRLWIAPSIGGRIIQYSFQEIGALYVMPSLEGKIFDLSLRDNETILEKRKEVGMKLYGGFKTWLAPQELWQGEPFIDLDLGTYRAEVCQRDGTISVFLTSPTCRETGIQFFRRIIINEHSRDVSVEMGMRNTGEQMAEYGLWDVTQVMSPGVAYFPLRSNEVSIKSFRETVPAGAQVIGSNIAKVDCRQSEGEFKVGTDYSEGWLLSCIEHGRDTFGYLKRFEKFEGGRFGHGCAVEVFNSHTFNYYEAEVHTPVTKLEVGEQYSTKQVWTLFKLNEGFEEDVRGTVQKRINW